MTFEPIRTEQHLLRPVRRTDAGALAERKNIPDVAKLADLDAAVLS
jgi:hypothetical protein|tara:strand:- start:3937 stop:4074 length:138 start_codon:yes stop_codon:yes gene_type:complete